MSYFITTREHDKERERGFLYLCSCVNVFILLLLFRVCAFAKTIQKIYVFCKDTSFFCMNFFLLLLLSTFIKVKATIFLYNTSNVLSICIFSVVVVFYIKYIFI